MNQRVSARHLLRSKHNVVALCSPERQRLAGKRQSLITEIKPGNRSRALHFPWFDRAKCMPPRSGRAYALLLLQPMFTVSGPEEDAESGQTMRGVVGGTKVFGRFTLQKVLGRGGMGIVWLAHAERLDRLVALKLVPESVNFDASAQEDLKRETRKSLLLTHPNIVRIFDFVEDEHSAAISMEYVNGATFSSMRVKKPNRCFEVDEIAPLVTALCDALSYAHESAGLVHRDLKPANLMANSRNELKITDFGIACTLRDSLSHASAPPSSGTLNYMSPQQLLGEDPSASDDIYAVGATLYEMLSSKPPFYGGDVASQVREVVPSTIAQRRAKLGIKGASIPKYWEETIAACLAKETERRPRPRSAKNFAPGSASQQGSAAEWRGPVRCSSSFTIQIRICPNPPPLTSLRCN